MRPPDTFCKSPHLPVGFHDVRRALDDDELVIRAGVKPRSCGDICRCQQQTQSRRRAAQFHAAIWRQHSPANRSAVHCRVEWSTQNRPRWPLPSVCQRCGGATQQQVIGRTDKTYDRRTSITDQVSTNKRQRQLGTAVGERVLPKRTRAKCRVATRRKTGRYCLAGFGRAGSISVRRTRLRELPHGGRLETAISSWTRSDECRIADQLRLAVRVVEESAQLPQVGGNARVPGHRSGTSRRDRVRDVAQVGFGIQWRLGQSGTNQSGSYPVQSSRLCEVSRQGQQPGHGRLQVRIRRQTDGIHRKPARDRSARSHAAIILIGGTTSRRISGCFPFSREDARQAVRQRTGRKRGTRCEVVRNEWMRELPHCEELGNQGRRCARRACLRSVVRIATATLLGLWFHRHARRRGLFDRYD